MFLILTSILILISGSISLILWQKNFPFQNKNDNQSINELITSVSTVNQAGTLFSFRSISTLEPTIIPSQYIKSYKNEKYDFEFQYPDNVSLKETNSNHNYIEFIVGIEGSKTRRYFNLFIDEYPSKNDIELYCLNSGQTDFKNCKIQPNVDFKWLNSTSKEINDILWEIDARDVFCKGDACSPPFIRERTIRNNMQYVFHVPDSKSNPKELDQIIDSFNFLSI